MCGMARHESHDILSFFWVVENFVNWKETFLIIVCSCRQTPKRTE